MNFSHVGELVLSEKQIQDGVEIVAAKLNKEFTDAVIITVVPGGILFTADLVRKLKFDLKMDNISCPHPPRGSNNQSTIVYHQNICLEGKDVIMVDDVIESGGTMTRLVSHVLEN